MVWVRQGTPKVRLSYANYGVGTPVTPFFYFFSTKKN